MRCSGVKRYRIDQTTADRLLRGEIGPDDAPRGFARVASLLHAARGSRRDSEPSEVTAAVHAMQAAIGHPTTPAVADPGTQPSMKKTVLLRTALASVAALSLTGGLAAAETLPAPVQDTVARAGRAVGLRLPHSARFRAAQFERQQQHLAAKCEEAEANGDSDRAERCREKEAQREEQRQAMAECREAREQGDEAKQEECRRQREQAQAEREQARAEREQAQAEREQNREDKCAKAEEESDEQTVERCRRAEEERRRQEERRQAAEERRRQAEECRQAAEAGDESKRQQCEEWRQQQQEWERRCAQAERDGDAERAERCRRAAEDSPHPDPSGRP